MFVNDLFVVFLKIKVNYYINFLFSHTLELFSMYFIISSSTISGNAFLSSPKSKWLFTSSSSKSKDKLPVKVFNKRKISIIK